MEAVTTTPDGYSINVSAIARALVAEREAATERAARIVDQAVDAYDRAGMPRSKHEVKQIAAAIRAGEPA